MNKRLFLKNLVAAAALLHLDSSTFAKDFSFNTKRLNILFLGGRGFLGPRIVKTLLEKGHRVTLLNRGITNPGLFQNLPLFVCDREKEHKKGLYDVRDQINDSKWDCVIDTWQKSPKAVLDFIQEFDSNIGHYHYISSFSVYDSWNKKGIDENEKLNPVPEFPKSVSSSYRYAIRKTLSELALMDHRGLDWTIYRCHGIRSDRIPDAGNPHEEPYWPVRFLQGGDILLPDIKNHNIQMTDAKSLSNFIAHCAEHKIEGAFNVAYPSFPFKEYIASLSKVTQVKGGLCWVPFEFLIQQKIKPREELEYWTRSNGGYYFSVQKALEKGLTNRPLSEMLQDQIDGYLRRYPENDFRFGGFHDGATVKLSSKKEERVLRAWNSYNSQNN